MKKILIWILRLVLLVVLSFAAFLLYSTLTDYQPPEKMDAIIYDGGDHPIDSVFEMLIWNIGYAGLGAESDFFFDGGDMTRPPKENVQKNIDGILSVVNDFRNVDFMLLQEVDSLAKRSYRFNEVEAIRMNRSNSNSAFAINYNVKHVPKPFDNPLGKVVSGLLSISKAQSIENSRYQFPGNFSWPVGLFFLDRCFLLQRFKVQNGKELIIINTHKSAYDDGSLKKQQMDFLKNVLQSEFDNGNYVVVGGDWNQNPANFKTESIIAKYPKKRTWLEVDENYLDGWQWVYDETIPTNRALNSTFNLDSSTVTIIDYYLISPNITVEEVLTVDLDFEYADHQPVYVKLRMD